jgi:hypothetical protein
VESTHPSFARGGVVLIAKLVAPHYSIVRWCEQRVLGKPFLDFFVCSEKEKGREPVEWGVLGQP